MPSGMEESVERAAGLGLAAASGPFDTRAVWQLTSMSVGAGIFTIPRVFVVLGTTHAAIWVIFMGALANLAMQRLLDAAEMYNLSSYEALSERAFGPIGKLFMATITLIATFIATLSYANTAKNLLMNTVVAFLLDVDANSQPIQLLSQGKTFAVLALMVGMMLPSVAKPTMGSNAWISQLAVVTVFSAAAFFVGHCLVLLGSKEGHMRPLPSFDWQAGDVLDNVATLAFSYSMVFALFPVLQERCAGAPLSVVVPTIRRPVAISVGVSCALYLVVGLVGAYTYGTDTVPFSLENLPLTEPLTQVITLMVGISVQLLVAIVVFPTVQSVIFFIHAICGIDCAGRGRAAVVLVLGIFIMIIDTFLEPKVAFALCGSLGLSLGAYVMPCVIFISLAHAMTDVGLRVTKTRRFLTGIVLLFGLLLLFCSTPVAIMRAASPGGGPEPKNVREILCNHFVDPQTQKDLDDCRTDLDTVLVRLAQAQEELYGKKGGDKTAPTNAAVLSQLPPGIQQQSQQQASIPTQPRLSVQRAAVPPPRPSPSPPLPERKASKSLLSKLFN